MKIHLSLLYIALLCIREVLGWHGVFEIIVLLEADIAIGGGLFPGRAHTNVEWLEYRTTGNFPGIRRIRTGLVAGFGPLRMGDVRLVAPGFMMAHVNQAGVNDIPVLREWNVEFRNIVGEMLGVRYDRFGQIIPQTILAEATSMHNVMSHIFLQIRNVNRDRFNGAVNLLQQHGTPMYTRWESIYRTSIVTLRETASVIRDGIFHNLGTIINGGEITRYSYIIASGVIDDPVTRLAIRDGIMLGISEIRLGFVQEVFARRDMGYWLNILTDSIENGVLVLPACRPSPH